MPATSCSTANEPTARLRSYLPTGIAVAAALAGFAFADAARAQQVPTVNIQDTCQMAASVTYGLGTGATIQNDVDICLKSENDARQQMIKNWSTFEDTDRKGCIQPTVYLPSYVEWLTCFEMNKIVRQLKQQGQGAPGLSILNPDGSFTMPTLPGRGMSSRSY